MTIAGDYGFEGLSSIDNASDSDQVFSVPVVFGTSGSEAAITVSNTGSGIVKFPGTVTGSTVPATTPVFDGRYVLTSASAWCPSADTVLRSGSSLEVRAYTGNNYLTIEEGGVLHVTGDATSTAQLLKANYGALRIDGNASVKGNLSEETGSSGEYRFGTLTQTDGNLYINNYRSDASVLDTAGVVFGAGGLPVVNRQIVLHSGMHHVFRFAADCTLKARAASGQTSGYGRINADGSGLATLYFDTDDFCDGKTPRNITMEAATTRCNFIIMGGGRLAYGCPSTSNDRSTGTCVVSNSATLAFSNNSKFVAGATTMLPGTTLELAASATVAKTFEGALTLHPGSTVSNATGLAAAVTPLTVPSLEFGEGEGSVVFYAGKSLAKGVYTLLASTAALPAGTLARIEVRGSGASGTALVPWISADGKSIRLTVAGDNPYAWTGAGGDGRMGNGANWLGGEVPAEGSPVDFSALAANTTIVADADRAFGAAAMGSGIVTFTGSLAVDSFSNMANVAVGAAATVTVAGDLSFSGSNARLCNTVAAGGKLWIKGVLSVGSMSSDFTLENTRGAGTIVLEGGMKITNANRWIVINAKTLVLGENGISSTVNWPTLAFLAAPTIYALGSKSVFGGGNINYSFQSGNDVTICTTQFESDRPATIEFKGFIKGQKSYYAGLVVTGCGKLKFTSSAITNRGIAVKDKATVVLDPAFQTTAANDQTLSIASGATVEIASAGTFASGFNSVSFADGATLSVAVLENSCSIFQFRSGRPPTLAGTVKVALADGSGPVIVKSYTLTANASLSDASNFALAKGVRGSLSAADGQLVYKAPEYFYIKVK